MKRLITLFLPLLACAAAYPQSWIKMMNDPSVNFYDVQKRFNKYAEKYEKKHRKKRSAKPTDNSEKKIPGYMQYKRWEWFIAPRVYPTGDRSVISHGANVIQAESNNNLKMAGQSGTPGLLSTGNWTLLGPTSTVPASGGGAGRLNCITIDPSNPNTLWVGAASGGIWKSVNGGITWSTNTDNLAVLGIADIAIDPGNSNIMYAATGDGDGGDTYSVGVLKSTDGGNTWNITGLNWLITSGRSMNRIIINPNNTDIIFAAGGGGIYRTQDAGATWVKVLNGAIKDIELKPGNSSTIYAASASGSFYRSTSGGITFSIITNGLPGLDAGRMAVAVTPADTNYVYVLAGRASDNGYLGVYRSTNSGAAFTTQSTTPNLLGWSSTGSDAGGQSWYDLSFDASPTDKNTVVVGGVNIWLSQDGGTDWTLNASWIGAGAPYVHADQHEIQFLPGSGTTYYSACDGGLFRTTNGGLSWTDLSNGLQIAQMYRLGNSVTNQNLVMQGWQDNGTSQWNAGGWNRILGGDGMECFIDYSNQAYRYGEQFSGSFNRSANNGASWVSITNGITESSAWVTPWGMDPRDSVKLYAGCVNMFISTNRGSNWSVISNFSSSAFIVQYAVCEQSTNYIYVLKPSTLYRTTNAGTTWSNITAGLPGGSSATYVAVCDTNPDIAYVTYSGYNATDKVYRTSDGGLTWQNITFDLPNIPVNCIVYQNNTKGGIYVGTDLGVYYRNDTLNQWLPYSNGLPNVVVDELEIQYAAGKLRAATYGRGLWETGLFNLSPAPSANFTADKLTGCPGLTVQFTDLSTNSPTNWSWTFPNGTPSSSTLKNPIVTFNVPGVYSDVKLVITNASGSDSLIKYNYIAISPSAPPTTSPVSPIVKCGTSILINASAGSSYSWLPGGQTTPYQITFAAGTYSVIVTDAFGCADTSAPIIVNIYPSATVPTITVSGNTLTSSPAAAYQWYMNNAVIPGATSQSYTYTSTGNYYVVITDTNGCTAQSSVVTGASETQLPDTSILITPNPNYGIFTVQVHDARFKKYMLEIFNLMGEVVKRLDGEFVASKKIKIDMSDKPPGIYFLSVKGEGGRIVQKFVVE